MKITEQASYLKGLIDGLDFKSDSKEGKIFSAISDLLENISYELDDLSNTVDELDEAIGIIDEDLEELENYVFDDDDDDDDDFDEDEDCDCCGDLYTVTCPNCGDVINLDNGMLDEGSIDCPNCGELLEFDNCDDCDCDCCKDEE